MSSVIQVMKVVEPKLREKALQVIEEVYHKEKNWINESDSEITAEINQSSKNSWFLATVNEKPAGVIKLCYDPSLDFPPELEVTLDKNVDVNKMAAEYRLVEIGRFMIVPKYRRNFRIALRLMKAAIKEVVERGYTHFLTDVFENEVNSPLHFHTKILGFKVIGRHLKGELNCNCTRIILTLDILQAYQRLRERKDKVYKEVTEGIRELLDEKLAGQARQA